MRRLTTTSIATPALLVGCVVFLPAPAAVTARTVSVSGASVVYQAAPGEQNNVGVRCTSTTECFITDSSAAAASGTGCVASGAEQRCTPADLDSIKVALGDHHDTASQEPAALT